MTPDALAYLVGYGIGAAAGVYAWYRLLRWGYRSLRHG